MFKFIALLSLVAVALAAPGFITETHHELVQPAVLAKTAVVDTRASSAITHQSFTNLEKKVPVVHTYAAAPVVHTYETNPTIVKTVAAAPVVYSYSTAPVVNAVAAGPVVHTYEAAPVLKSVAASPVVHTYAAAPVAHSLPILHSSRAVNAVVSSPFVYNSYN